MLAVRASHPRSQPAPATEATPDAPQRQPALRIQEPRQTLTNPDPENNMNQSFSSAERDVLEVLRRRGGAVETNELLRICFTDFSTLERLEEQGHVYRKEGGVWLTSLKS